MLGTAWLAGCGRPAAWLALDENDRDPVRFPVYRTCALRQIAPDFGAGILDILQSPQPPPIASVLTALLNEITTTGDTVAPGTGAAGTGAFILVLDDYHVVDSKGVDEALTLLVEHLPPQLHLAITTPRGSGAGAHPRG